MSYPNPTPRLQRSVIEQYALTLTKAKGTSIILRYILLNLTKGLAVILWEKLLLNPNVWESLAAANSISFTGPAELRIKAEAPYTQTPERI